MAITLHYLARAACEQDDYERTAQLIGAVDAIQAATEAPLPLTEREAHSRMVDKTRAHLGDAAYTTARSVGQAMSLEQAIAYALDEAPEAAEQTATPA
jgi:non-specific serine/threonine protein kinase